MTEQAKKVWVQIRAELICKWHEINNPGKFINGFNYNTAKEIAEHQLEYDLMQGALRISVEDLLMKSDEECLEILRQKDLDQIKKLIQCTNK